MSAQATKTRIGERRSAACHWCEASPPTIYATGLDGAHHLACGSPECGYDQQPPRFEATA